jgi:hypothetical protein
MISAFLCAGVDALNEESRRAEPGSYIRIQSEKSF